ncbi:MAG: type VII toxin-antitoxin system MntA family adenylyltransferase antitoxin [Candidatus Entotheonellia bacterium]
MKRDTKTAVDKLLTMACHDSEVLAVLLFGSVARGERTPGSDIDVCLVLVPQSTAYTGTYLSRKRLKYLAHFDLDVQLFQQLPLYVRKRVLKEGRVLFVRDEDLRYAVAFRTIQAYEDFKPIYSYYLEQVAHGGS